MLTLKAEMLIVNSGSVGLPAYKDDLPVPHFMQSFSPHATYTIVEKVVFGWNVQRIKVAYDFQRAANESKKISGHNWAKYLETGRSEN